MRVFFLPRSEHNFEQRFTLDGSDYLVRFTWNARSGRWYWEMTDIEGNALTGQRKLVADWDLLDDITSGTLPPGQLWTLTPDGVDPGLLDLDRDFALIYIPEDEVPS